MGSNPIEGTRSGSPASYSWSRRIMVTTNRVSSRGLTLCAVAHDASLGTGYSTESGTGRDLHPCPRVPRHGHHPRRSPDDDGRAHRAAAVRIRAEERCPKPIRGRPFGDRWWSGRPRQSPLDLRRPRQDALLLSAPPRPIAMSPGAGDAPPKSPNCLCDLRSCVNVMICITFC